MPYVGGFVDHLVSVLDFDARGCTRRALTSMSATGQPSCRHWKRSLFVAGTRVFGSSFSSKFTDALGTTLAAMPSWNFHIKFWLEFAWGPWGPH